MMSLLFFFGTAVILIVEGRMITVLITRGSLTRSEEWALGFPMGAFANALLFFVWTVLGVSLSTPFVFGGHLVILAMLEIMRRVRRASTPLVSPKLTRSAQHDVFSVSVFSKLLALLFALAIAIKLFYGVSHALMPTYYYDSVSQWTMRAKISSIDQAIAFDTDELRGMSKPQYPILLHSLQIFFNLPQNVWKDSVANGATLLLSVTSFFALFLLIKRYAGIASAVLAMALILTIPLLSMHLGQGYGDIHMLAFILLSALSLLFALREGNSEMLLLSAVLISASSWVKQEGLIFGVLPFLLILMMSLVPTRFARRLHFGGTKLRRTALLLFGVLPALFLSLPWPLLLFAKGLPLSPHGGGDLVLAFHGDAVSEALRQLFAAGSFGVHWYLAIMFLMLIISMSRKSVSAFVPILPMFFWAGITLLGGLIIFLATPNVQFLLNAQTFCRTMLIPLALLFLGISIVIPWLCAGDNDALA